MHLAFCQMYTQGWNCWLSGTTTLFSSVATPFTFLPTLFRVLISPCPLPCWLSRAFIFCPVTVWLWILWWSCGGISLWESWLWVLFQQCPLCLSDLLRSVSPLFLMAVFSPFCFKRWHLKSLTKVLFVLGLLRSRPLGGLLLPMGVSAFCWGYSHFIIGLSLALHFSL